MTMDSEKITREESQFVNLMIRTRILSADAQRYEDLFTAVMTLRESNFTPIKPQGNIGDQGNDGYVADEGLYYQCYAPETPEDSVSTAAKKATDDFAKLLANWSADSPVTDYRFVFNDKYKGSFPAIEHALNELKAKHSLNSAKAFLAKDLEREFMKLPLTEMQTVLQAVIPHAQYIADIEHDALTDVLQHLVDTQPPISAEGVPRVPGFEDKIAFNGLADATPLLTVGNYQNAAVEDYFNRHGDFRKTDIRDRLAKSYLECKDEVSKTEGEANQPKQGDLVFFAMLNDITPGTERQVQDAAIVLIAYFFEKCDVFEDPAA